MVGKARKERRKHRLTDRLPPTLEVQGGRASALLRDPVCLCVCASAACGGSSHARAPWELLWPLSRSSASPRLAPVRLSPLPPARPLLLLLVSGLSLSLPLPLPLLP